MSSQQPLTRAMLSKSTYMKLSHKLSMVKFKTLLLPMRNNIQLLRKPSQNLKQRRPRFRKQLLLRTSKMTRIILVLTLRKERKMPKSREKMGSLRTKAERKTRKRRVGNEQLSFIHEIIL